MDYSLQTNQLILGTIPSVTYQIDQSGKIEQTNLDTIIAISNRKKYAVVLRKKDKRILQKFFRSTGRPRIFIYSVFSLLVALIIKEVEPSTKVIIDIEYTGHKKNLKKQITKYLAYLNYRKHLVLEFGFIGKKSPAHKLASEVANKKKRPNKIIELEKMGNIIYP